jgi:hypothetical protein
MRATLLPKGYVGWRLPVFIFVPMRVLVAVQRDHFLEVGTVWHVVSLTDAGHDPARSKVLAVSRRLDTKRSQRISEAQGSGMSTKLVARDHVDAGQLFSGYTLISALSSHTAIFARSADIRQMLKGLLETDHLC